MVPSFLLLPLVIGWRNTLPLETCDRVGLLTYSVEESFCSMAKPLFQEDSLFTFRGIECNDIRKSIRSGFDAWSYNLPSLTFVEVNSSSPNITFTMSRYEDTSFIASARGVWRRCREWRGVPLEIHVGEEECWYVDSSFCHSVSRARIPLTLVLAATWSLSGGGVVHTLLKPFDKVDSVFRIATWSVFTACPFVAFGALRPCLNCYDFTSTIVHEVGHLLGLSHSDEGIQTCGCGSGATQCSSLISYSPIMNSVAKTRPLHCPSKDDVDGARSLVDPSLCGEDVLCYEETSFAGFARISIALVYSFLLSWFIVCTRNAVCGERRRRRLLSRSPVSSSRRGGIGIQVSGRRR